MVDVAHCVDRLVQEHVAPYAPRLSVVELARKVRRTGAGGWVGGWEVGSALAVLTVSLKTLAPRVQAALRRLEMPLARILESEAAATTDTQGQRADSAGQRRAGSGVGGRAPRVVGAGPEGRESSSTVTGSSSESRPASKEGEEREVGVRGESGAVGVEVGEAGGEGGSAPAAGPVEADGIGAQLRAGSVPEDTENGKGTDGMVTDSGAGGASVGSEEGSDSESVTELEVESQAPGRSSCWPMDPARLMEVVTARCARRAGGSARHGRDVT